MRRESGFIKKQRAEAGLTQAQLAKKMSVSQALVSKWEKENKIDYKFKNHWKLAVGLSEDADLNNLEIFGGDKNIELWTNFINEFMDGFAEGGGSHLEEFISEIGLWTLFKPLHKIGFMPALPKLIRQKEENSDWIDYKIKYPTKDDEYFFSKVFNEFLLWHDNFLNALSVISNYNQITDKDWRDLHNYSITFVWANLFEHFVDTSCLENSSYFGDSTRPFYEELRVGHELIADSWYRAFKASQRSDRHEDIVPPMWVAGQLCEAATSDISYRFDFDFKHRILRGEPLDPHDYQNMQTLENLQESVNELHKKIDTLTNLLKK
ncbi:helix-turn-helix transcriptional regulator [Endozoicomonas sp. 4G]|uniref:helix-turn-helix transcriptional regulator n=1 Tax=Endozoicomonas sp. 4G TaxID=2872754 RepID=UPI002078E2D8|nr:helix-turn-helix transcriptional regulator [Endozoicomonas sp. 4G]